MSYQRGIAFVGIALYILCIANADVVNWKPCSDTDPPIKNNCVINELRVTPCKEAIKNEPCRLKRGINATIEFDYTTNFTSNSLEGKAYWATPLIELPLIGMNDDACLVTSCPVVPNQLQTYSMVLPISKSYPVRVYDVKWRLKSPEGEQCCFMFKIKLHK